MPKTFACNTCHQTFSTHFDLTRHRLTHNVHATLPQSTPTVAAPMQTVPLPQSTSTDPALPLVCPGCGTTFTRRGNLTRHINGRCRGKKRPHAVPLPTRQHGGGYDPNLAGHEPWVNEDGSIDEQLRNLYQENSVFLARGDYEYDDLSREYNFRCSPLLNPNEIYHALLIIMHKLGVAFKFNFGMSIVLKHRTNHDFRLWYAHENFMVLDEPVYIHNLDDIEQFIKRLKSEDIINKAMFDSRFSGSEWIFHQFAQVRVRVFPTDLPLSSPVDLSDLPDFVKRSRSVWTFKKDSGNICMFRCLSCLGCSNLEDAKGKMTEITVNKQIFLEKTGRNDKTFQGVNMFGSDLQIFEDLFKVRVNLYNLRPDKKVSVLHRSIKSGDGIRELNVLVHNNHAMYIKCLSAFLHKYICRNCSMCFKTSSKLVRHEGTCMNAVKLKFNMTSYKPNKTIFHTLEAFGVNVPMPLRLNRYLATFDFEALCGYVDELQNQDTRNMNSLTDQIRWREEAKTKFLATHKPLSVSICSNVSAEYKKPKSFINRDVDILLHDMLQYLEQISDAYYAMLKEKYSFVFNKLQALIDSECPDSLVNFAKAVIAKDNRQYKRQEKKQKKQQEATTSEALGSDISSEYSNDSSNDGDLIEQLVREDGINVNYEQLFNKKIAERNTWSKHVSQLDVPTRTSQKKKKGLKDFRFRRNNLGFSSDESANESDGTVTQHVTLSPERRKKTKAKKKVHVILSSSSSGSDGKVSRYQTFIMY